jgi:hypothetical protein
LAIGTWQLGRDQVFGGIYRSKQRRAPLGRTAEGGCPYIIITPLLRDHCRLPGEFEALAAAHVFAGEHVIFAHHIGSEFCEAGAIALVGAPGELSLLAAHHPGHFVFGRLVTMRAIQRSWLFFLALIKKVAFFHGLKLQFEAARYDGIRFPGSH